MTTTLQALSREFARLTGIEWHEQVSDTRCSCGAHFAANKAREHFAGRRNPDFRDAREVLKVIRAIGLEGLFARCVGGYGRVTDLLLDETGLLLVEAVEFLRGEGMK